MKRNLLWILLIVAITVSAFGVYYLHKSNYFVRNNQMSENEFGKTSKSSEKPGAENPGESQKWRLLAWRDESGYIPPNGLSEADIAVWRPSDGTWYLLQSANGQRIVSFGANGDVPIPAVP